MKHRAIRLLNPLLVLLPLTATLAAVFVPNLSPFPDPAGAVATFNASGDIDGTGAFFQSLGTNGRTCATCHRFDQAMSLSSHGVQSIYRQSHGTDPLFAAIDGANCPTDDASNRASHSLLLDRGLIRVGLPLPSNRQFSISVVHDPYGCAITHDPNTGADIVSVYRRPIPATNLRFLSAVMFDGRETILPLTSSLTFQANLEADLKKQALDAIQGHAQATYPPTDAQLNEIVDFELGLTTAQMRGQGAGMLYKHGASGGPVGLANQAYYPGVNDTLGADPTGAKFNASAMTVFSAWNADTGFGPSEYEDGSEMRARIAAGERLFNTAVATITDVRGLNDNPALGSPAVIKGTCTTCHDTPNVGNHSLPLPLDIATSRLADFESNPDIVAGLAKLSPPDLPVFEVSGCTDAVNPSVKLTYYTSDPGKALISGKCSDVNRGKGPVLRGLAARAPYFHNGAAPNLQQLVDFYNGRFQMNLTAEQKEELIAFLNSL
jgi:cytochrome c peroxidase